MCKVDFQDIFDKMKSEIEQTCSWYCFDDWGNCTPAWDSIKSVIDNYAGDEILSRKEKEIAYQQGLEDGRKQGVAIDGSKRYWDGYHAAQKDGKKIYQQGLEDAWSAARKIMLPFDDCLKSEELEEIFGANMGIRTILKTFSASEAIEKIKEYEAKKTERNDNNE